MTIGEYFSDNYGIHVKGTRGIRVESGAPGWFELYHTNRAGGQSGADFRLHYSNDANYWWWNSIGQSGRSSDRELKQDIEPLKTTLSRLLDLRPVTFRYKGAAEDSPKVSGFIAQEVESLFPDLVSGEEGNKGLAESDIIPIAVAALQEEHQQRRETDARHEEEVRTLKAENAALLQRLQALEKRMGMEAPAGAGGEIK